MAQFTYLVYKSQPQLGSPVFNGVVAVLVNASSVASAKTNAVAACNAAFTASEAQTEAVQACDVFGAGYFDSAVAVSASAGVPASGNGSANGDSYILLDRAAPQYLDHSAYSPVA